uniref:GST C-terminal domain-containing protein n=1 Tax=Panagrellus redivivus TaxID=6233 RepID=A0A7E4V676_PANRE
MEGVKYPRVHPKWVEKSPLIQRMLEKNEDYLNLPKGTPIAAGDLLYMVTEWLFPSAGNSNPDIQYSDLLKVDRKLVLDAIDLADDWNLNINELEEYFGEYFRPTEVSSML